MKKPSKQLAKQLRSSQRVQYPDDEARHPWLSILLDGYHVIDVGISIELKQEEEKHRTSVTCRKGCSNCCLRPTVPIGPLEELGISWFATEKLQGDVREAIRKQLLIHGETLQCPFLLNSLCSIYLVRPVACRMFFVFGKQCELGEHLEQTRPSDIWTHSRDLARRVAMIVLPFYGITGKRNKIQAFQDGYIGSISRPMHEYPWDKLGRKMK
ncbi:MAG: YkgJ family cysteine cluster protein [Dehalococcoidia bacterium]|nr:YkgJ family cysteine cluster protein [Dehalococcoidia bacterium]